MPVLVRIHSSLVSRNAVSAIILYDFLGSLLAVPQFSFPCFLFVHFALLLPHASSCFLKNTSRLSIALSKTFFCIIRNIPYDAANHLFLEEAVYSINPFAFPGHTTCTVRPSTFLFSFRMKPFFQAC